MDEDRRHDEEAPGKRVLDTVALKALAHPLRVQIIDALSTYGPQTASGLGERLGESSGVTSYHLRQLERHEFVQEVEGRGTARERWWERTPGAIWLESHRLPQTSAVRAATRIVEREWSRSRETLLREYEERGADELPALWLDAGTVSTVNLRLTPDQLHDLVRSVGEVLDGFVDRYRDQRTHPVPGSRPVQVHLNAFPVLGAAEDDARGGRS